MLNAASTQPVRLRPDNFTPPTRTPWGGRRILEVYKGGLELDAEKAAYPVVGESWEISVDPAFPSRAILADGREVELGELLRSDASAFLGEEGARRHGGSTPMLIKLLDADAKLSVQVHPEDSFAGLGPDESGKPECWYVVGAEPHAGLYLGLSESASEQKLREALTAGDDISDCLN
ncbi:type I phosphomannose isomerase catalytic subunit, partial [Planctomycetota bacterium]